MARVEDWATDFLLRHMERFPRPDWPEMGSEFWLAWVSALKRHGITEAVADGASRAMAESPPPFIDQHLKALLEGVELVWAASEGALSTESRERALADSRTCPECSGGGQTFRRFLTIDGRPLTLAFCCLCYYGQWLYRSREQADETKACPGLNLADYPSLWEPGLSFRGWPERPLRIRHLSAVRTAGGREILIDRPVLSWQTESPPADYGATGTF